MWVTASCVAVLFCVARLQPTVGDAQRRNAEAQVDSLTRQVDRYAKDHGALPSALSDLVESSSGEGSHVRAKDLIDPYGHAFVYIAPGAHGAFDIVFLGKDGAPGGSGYDADFGNWELVQSQ
jgi:general secretion pathway protein G